MINLPHGCRCSGTPADPKKGIPATLAVFPKNWRSERASIRKKWYLHYRFYDPSVTDGKYSKGKLVVRESKVNSFKTLHDRQLAMDYLLSCELDLLIHQGYNPITETIKPPEESGVLVIDPNTLFLQALRYALDSLQCVKETKDDVRSSLTYIEMAATDLKYHYKSISAIKKREIKTLLDYMKQHNISKEDKDGNKKPFSNEKYNRYRAYLSMLFSALEDIDTIEYNPVIKVKKLKKVKRIRLTLTPEEDLLVDEHLLKSNPDLHRLKHIFYHSGGRKTELVGVTGKDVDLKGQRFKALVKKGTEYREVWKVIKKAALPFWEEQMKNCGPDDFVFSNTLLPGTVKLRTHHISKLWKRWVKDKLGIKADFYALKHKHTTDVVDEELKKIEQAQRIAAENNSHTSGNMVATVYDIRSKQRLDDALKSANS